jgi:hypothetical protein
MSPGIDKFREEELEQTFDGNVRAFCELCAVDAGNFCLGLSLQGEGGEDS